MTPLNRTLIAGCLFALSACGDNAARPVEPPKTQTVQPPKGWSYASSTDEVTQLTSQRACVLSDEELHQDAPYSNTRAELCVRFKGGKLATTMVALVGNGQMLCDIPTCSYVIRFADEKPMTVAMGQADNGDSSVAFFDRPAPIYKHVLRAHILRVQIPLYQQPKQAVTFRLDGLNPDAKSWGAVAH